MTITDGDRVTHGRIDDLSTCGVRIATDDAWPLDQRVRLTLQFDVLPEILSTRGHVAWWSDSDHRLAVAFDDIDGVLSAYVLDELEAATLEDCEPHVLLVEIASTTRDSIATSFRDHGLIVTTVATPLDAIHTILRDRFDPSLIAVADTLPESVAEDLRTYLASEYPDAHMIAIGISSSRRDPAGSWLSSGEAQRERDTSVGRIVRSHGARARPLAARPRCQRPS